MAGALDVLPALPLDGDDRRERQRATGTDAGALAPLLAPNPAESSRMPSFADKTSPDSPTPERTGDRDVTGEPVKSKQPLTGVGNKKDDWAMQDSNLRHLPCKVGSRSSKAPQATPEGPFFPVFSGVYASVPLVANWLPTRFRLVAA